MSLSIKIKKRLGDFLLDVDFTSEEGVSGLLGASGCGKSLTLRSVAGIVKPDSGKIILNGTTLFDSEKGINLPPQKRRVGYLFQNYALFPNMTVEQNIACGLHQEQDRAARKAAVSEMIRRLRLTGLEKHRPHQLSGGQQQRTALARILVGSPEILLLDEPFSALDSHLKEQLHAELRAMLKIFDKDTLLVTHSRDEAYKLCEKLALMDNGQITAAGDTKAIFADPGTWIGAMLTGCKNIINARKAGDTLVEVPDWGVTFSAGKPVGDNLSAIGIRAHYFCPQTVENSVPIRILEDIEEPFEWTFKFKYIDQDEDSEPIWWRISKGEMSSEPPEKLGVAPEDILLLYDERSRL